MITVYTMYTLGQPFVALYKTEGLLCFQFVGSPRIVTVAAISQDSNPATPNVSTNMEEF